MRTIKIKITNREFKKDGYLNGQVSNRNTARRWLNNKVHTENLTYYLQRFKEVYPTFILFRCHAHNQNKNN